MHSFSINASSGTQPYGNVSRSVQAAAAVQLGLRGGSCSPAVQGGMHSPASPASAGRLALLKLHNLRLKMKVILGMSLFLFVCLFVLLFLP